MKFFKESKLFCIFLLFVFLFPFVYGEDTIKIERDTYSEYESVQFWVYSEILLTPENVKLICNETKIDIGLLIFHLKNNTYFLSFELPELEESDCSIVISYKKRINATLKTFSFYKNFTIKNEEPYLCIKPSIVFVTEDTKTFAIKLSNKGLNKTEVKPKSNEDAIRPFRESLIIEPLSSLNVYFSVDVKNITVKETSVILNYGNKFYEIPVIIKKEEKEAPTCNDGIKNQGERGVDCGGPCEAIDDCCNNGVKDEGEEGVDCGGVCGPCEIVEKEFKLKFLMKNKSLSKRAPVNKIFIGEIKFKNDGEYPINQISIKLDGNLNEIVKIDKKTINVLQPYETTSLNIVVNEDKNAIPGKLYYGNLIVSSKEGRIEFPMSFLFTNVAEEVKNKTELVELNISKEKEVVIVNYTETKTPKEELREEKKKKILRTIVVVIILLVVFLVILFIRAKAKKPKLLKIEEYVEKIKK